MNTEKSINQKFDINLLKATKLLVSDNFLRDIKKYESMIIPFLNSVQNNLFEKGLEFLNSKKNEKLLSNTDNKVFEFRSPIKGHRILFKYGWQLKNLDLNINKDDIILCKYVNDHERISDNAKSIKDSNFDEIKNFKAEEFEIDFVSEEEKTNENKIYIYNKNINYLIPILNYEQTKILNSKEQYVFVNGIAGSGKTNLCIQKILIESILHKKVIYSTYSRKLLNSTQETIYYNYLNEIKEIIDEYNKHGFSQGLIYHINNLNFDIDLSEISTKKLNEMHKDINSVHYNFLIDILNDKGNHKKVVDLKVFQDLINSQVFSFDLRNKLKDSEISLEVLFKEIEGVILGLETDKEIISFDRYQEERKNAFNDKTLNLIYSIAKIYLEYIVNSNEYIDKNLIALSILQNSSLKEIYDIAVLDEVQDFTQKELLAFKHVAKNVFAVGDPLQMVNPSYFSFDKLKQLFGSNHKEYTLDLNYRNTKPLNNAINALMKINKDKLGTHSKILKEAKTADIQESTYLFFTNQNELFDKLNNSEFNDYCIVVATEEEQKSYAETNKEILTISEVKGLERGTIVLYNILTSHKDEWKNLEQDIIDKKKADENSLLRYYFNIFYVGITRAQRHLLIVENEDINLFKDFFNDNFEFLDQNVSIETLQTKLDLNTLTDDERVLRISEALKNNIFANALHHINWIKDLNLKVQQQKRFDLYKEFYSSNNTSLIRDKFIDENLIVDAIEISNEIKEFDVSNVLHNIYYESKLNIRLCYDILMKDSSDKIKQIVSKALRASRTELIEKNNLLKDILKEI